MFGIEYRAVVIVALFCSFDIKCASLDNKNAVPVSSVDSSLASSTISSTDGSIHSATNQAKPTTSTAQQNDFSPPAESTVSSDPDLTTNSSESTSSTSKTVTSSEVTSTLNPIVTPSSTSSSITPTATPISPTTNSASPPPRITTVVPIPHNKRQFDGPSFIGGIILASGLMAIAFVAFKFYKARTEQNYHTL